MRKFFLFLTLLVIGCLFLPQFVSIIWGKQKISVALEKHLGGKIEIEHLSLRWFGEQRCKHVKWIDSTKKCVFTAPELIFHSNLFNLFSKSLTPLNISIQGAKLYCSPHFRLLKKKDKDYEILFSPVKALIDKKIICFESIALKINGSIEFKTQGKVDLSKKEMNLHFHLPRKTVQKVFGTKNLSDDFFLEFPIFCKLTSKDFEKKLFFIFLKNYTKLKL